MLVDDKAALFRQFLLPSFDFVIDKLFDFAAGNANEMVVVFALVKLKNGAATLEMPADQYVGLGKLH